MDFLCHVGVRISLFSDFFEIFRKLTWENYFRSYEKKCIECERQIFTIAYVVAG